MLKLEGLDQLNGKPNQQVHTFLAGEERLAPGPGGRR